MISVYKFMTTNERDTNLALSAFCKHLVESGYEYRENFGDYALYVNDEGHSFIVDHRARYALADGCNSLVVDSFNRYTHIKEKFEGTVSGGKILRYM